MALAIGPLRVIGGMSKKFQVNLRGIIDLLSKHLYSSPEVFVRELLQNGVDAVVARRLITPAFEGNIHIEVTTPADAGPPTLTFIDDGVGLTADEAERFLAVIGESSKRDALGEARKDFIGQFGIGLLACFVVSDEIVVVSRSARGDEPAIEWKGFSDGTYSVRTLTQQVAPGTRIFLRAKDEHAELLDPEKLAESLKHYGRMLSTPVFLTVDGERRRINPDPPPWGLSSEGRPSPKGREALLESGRRTLGGDYLDAIPLRAKAGGVSGVAFVLPQEASPHARHDHSVYLKGMYLTGSARGLLPDWAFFVRCVINVEDLRPTASREGLYEDAKLARASEALGDCIRTHLAVLAERDPSLLARIILQHHRAIKALAVEDDDFYPIVIDYLPFETTAGMLSLGAYRAKFGHPRFISSVDEFRQVAPVAVAQSICLINAGYAYERELLMRLPQLLPDARVEEFDATQLMIELGELPLDQQQASFDLLMRARSVLASYGCEVEMRKFLPQEMTGLYVAGDDVRFRRTTQQTIEQADPLWSGMVEKLAAGDARMDSRAVFCLNYHNPVIQRLAKIEDAAVLRRILPMLYVQSLMLGRHPLSSQEMRTLNQGIGDLIEWGLAGSRP